VRICGDQTGDTITFSPISGGAVAEAPFQFTTAEGEVVRGALRLRTPAGILAIAMIRPPADELLTRAWVFALGSFADLTCVREHTVAQSHERSPRPPASARDDRERPTVTIPRRPRQPSSRPSMSDRLTPSAASASVLRTGHYVAGYKARLTPPKQARAAARQHAAAHAIVLGPNETWTREHWRGIAGDKPLLELVWREVDDIALSARPRSRLPSDHRSQSGGSRGPRRNRSRTSRHNDGYRIDTPERLGRRLATPQPTSSQWSRYQDFGDACYRAGYGAVGG
jgi:hypothetical protein